MSVWLVLPSARPAAEASACFAYWQEMGYRVCIMRDSAEDVPTPIDALFTPEPGSGYPGYSRAVNMMAKAVLQQDPACDWIVCGGDDTYPDPNKTADEIAAECSVYFGIDQATFRIESMTVSDQLNEELSADVTGTAHSTFGVMQPTGDPWADFHKGKMSRIIERIAGSPWLGRDWCLRAYQGNGPLCAEYTHCFADEELQLVAQRLGVFWQRPDLTHHHEHWSRTPNATRIPPHLAEATSKSHWDKYKAIFDARKAAGFPGSEPL